MFCYPEFIAFPLPRLFAVWNLALFLWASPKSQACGTVKESKKYFLNDRQNPMPRLPPILNCTARDGFLVGGSELHKASQTVAE